MMFLKSYCMKTAADRRILGAEAVPGGQMVAWKDPEEWLEGRTQEGDSRWKWPPQQAGMAGGRDAGEGGWEIPCRGTSAAQGGG